LDEDQNLIKNAILRGNTIDDWDDDQPKNNQDSDGSVKSASKMKSQKSRKSFSEKRQDTT